MKTRILTAAIVLSNLPSLYAQPSLEMKDMFTELNDQVQESTGVLSTICYAIAGVCFLVGGISVTAKILKGNEVGKDVGMLFFAMGVFLILGYLCQKFWE